MCTSANTKKTSVTRGGSEKQFPGKLHDLMTYVEQEGLDDTISWIANGRAFKVHKPEKLLQILPMFFGQTKYRSFQRQLNMWHFQRILHGPDRGGFMHPYFVRGNKALCAYMSRHLFDKPTILGSNIEVTKMQLPGYIDLSRPVDITCEELMGITKELDNQLITTTDQIQCVAKENPASPLSLDPIDLDALNFESKKFHFLDGSWCEMNKQHDQRTGETMKQTNSYFVREQGSASLSQLLEPISAESFETLF